MKRLIGLLYFISLTAFAHDNLAPHSHDKLTLDVVVDVKDNKVIFAIEGAGIPILGFEGKANSEDKKEKLKKATELWKDAPSWLGLLKNQGCKVAAASFENNVEEEEDLEGHHHSSSHSEIEAELVISCKDISKIKSTTFSFFKKIEELKITKNKVKEIELSVIQASESSYNKKIKTTEFEIVL